MVVQERINVRETVGRKSNCKVNFFSMYFVWTSEEIHVFFKNSEKKAGTSFKLFQISVLVQLKFLTPFLIFWYIKLYIQ